MSFITKIDTATELQREFAEYDRDNYNYETYEGIIEYMEGTGEDMELDVIAWCCDLTEETYEETIANFQELRNEIEEAEVADEDEVREIVQNWLIDKTTVIANEDGFITYLAF